MYFAQRFLSLEFSTCFLSFITLAASSSLPFFPCISSHFPCSCPLPSHDFLLMCLSSLYPPPRIHTSTCADGGLALFLSDGWKCQHCEGTEVRTARQPVKLLSCSGLGDWLTGRLQWRGKRSFLALPQMAQYTASCKSRFTYFLCLIIFFFFLYRTSSRMGENRWSSVWSLLCWVSAQADAAEKSRNSSQLLLRVHK